MKRRNRIHLRATEKETAMLRELASDLDTTITGAVFDAVRFAYLHLDLIVAWNKTYKHEESEMSRLSDDEKRYFSDQMSMLKNENERLTKYVEYSKDDKECMQNEIDVLEEAKSILLAIGVTLTQCIGNIKPAGITDEELEDMKRIHADILGGK